MSYSILDVVKTNQNEKILIIRDGNPLLGIPLKESKSEEFHLNIELEDADDLYADPDVRIKVKLGSIQEKAGTASEKSQKKVIKKSILDQTHDYFDNVFAREQKKAFKPEVTKVNYAGRVFDSKELENLVDSSLEFWLTYGRFSVKFERLLSKYLGVEKAFLVNSGSSANLLAFMALTSPLLKERRINRGDEVITVAAGFPTTVAPIIQFGAVPVFVDIEIQTANIDTSLLETALSSKTKAVMLAHTLGNPFNIEKVRSFCEQNSLWLIEDNCDALGSEYKGKLTGTWGDVATSSFYPPHHMTMGEGGAVYSNNPTINKILLSLRDWGRDCWCLPGTDNTCGVRFEQQQGDLPYGYDHKYVYSHFGYNLKVSDMQAAIGCAQLEKIGDFTNKRRENFDFFYDSLSKYSEYFYLFKKVPESSPSWFGFLLTVKNDASFSRAEIVNFLESKKIQTRSLFAGNITKHPAFSDLTNGMDYRIVGELTNTNNVMNSSFWFGVYPGLSEEEKHYIISCFDKFMEGR